jgi:hypothetical protein
MNIQGEPLDAFTNGIFKGLEEGKKEFWIWYFCKKLAHVAR